MANQFEGKKYRNMFTEVGIRENDIAQRLEDIKDYYFMVGMMRGSIIRLVRIWVIFVIPVIMT